VQHRDCAGEIGDEEQRALQRRDEDRLEAVVVGRDLGAELRDPCLDLLGGEVRVADANLVG
jgi:hypothetical protein